MNTKPTALFGESPKPRKREPHRPQINPRGGSSTRLEAMEPVTKKTDLLVVGDQDSARLAEGETMSSKLKKAATLGAGGQDIELIGESEFLRRL